MLVVGLVVGFILGYTVSNYSVHHFLLNSFDISQIDDSQKVLALILLSSMIFSFFVFMPIKKIINGFEQIDRGNIAIHLREGVTPTEDQKAIPQKSSQSNLQKFQQGGANSGSSHKI